MHDIPTLDRRELRDFGLVTGAIFVVLFGLFIPWLFDLKIPTWPWVLWGILSVWGLAAPMTLDPIYRGWMRFGLLLSRITTPLVLGIVFFAMIFPLGFVMRRFGWDPMARNIDNDAESYRVPSTKPRRENFERPF